MSPNRCKATLVCVLCQTLLAATVVRAEAPGSGVPYPFTVEDQTLLDEIQRASFDYLWNEVGSPAELVKDRRVVDVSSVAGVGFQLSALVVGVERGWIEKAAAEKRAVRVLTALARAPGARRHGVFLHYVDPNTAGPSQRGYEVLASTADHALLLAGAIPAAVYFQGPTADLVDELIADTRWSRFAVEPEGFLSMGWRPEDRRRIEGPGQLHKRLWRVASEEERIVYLMAAAAPDAPGIPEAYYRLRRARHELPGGRSFVMSETGSLFHYWFAQLWLDCRRLGPDEPARFGSEEPPVDWYENTRLAILTHRARCLELADRYRTFGPDRWGLSACAGRDGYLAPELRPNLIDKDRVYEGTIAPYAAAASIAFTPGESLAALRAFRSVRHDDGRLAAWRDPDEGGYGLADAFNLDQGFTSPEDVAIDHGPVVLGIENARSGLIWRLFATHPAGQRAMTRLGMATQ